MDEERAATGAWLTGGEPEGGGAAGYKWTEAGVIPDDWDVARIGDVADIKNGATPSTGIAANWNGSIPWCTPTDVTNTSGKYLTGTARSITRQGLGACGASLLPAGALLLCSRATIGEIRIASVPVCTNQGFKSLIARDRVHGEFLYYLVLVLKPRLIRQAIGSTFLEVGKRALASMQVQVPPLKEQRAIAEALSDVDGLIESLEALIAKKRAVKTAAMQQLLTGRTRLPGFSDEWEQKRFGDVCKFLSTANNPRADLEGHGNVGYIHYGNVHAHPLPVLDCRYHELPRIEDHRIGNAPRLQDGDLVMVDASEDLTGIGKSVEIMNVGNEKIVAGLHTILCRGKSHHWATGFKSHLQYIPEFKSALERVATGISVYAVSRRQLADVVLALPPLQEQAAMVSVLSEFDAEIVALDGRLAKVRALKQGMMQQLLTGRIRLPASPGRSRRVDRTVGEVGQSPRPAELDDLRSMEQNPSTPGR